MSACGFSSSGSASNQAKEGTENIEGNEFSTGGKYSTGMSSSGSTSVQADVYSKNKGDDTRNYTAAEALKTATFQK
ncbi:unnamed protein product [Adineta ricciae]|uniref:Uncharacterized protein n=1 Tax=Adineta ricciae TaxID=249248 RepID=A0A814ZTY8_ADIRI|nr:unnamed protein product [Adineta ricciae]CAF1249961.1 unnamed protein product [Adineta ricciae]